MTFPSSPTELDNEKERDSLLKLRHFKPSEHLLSIKPLSFGQKIADSVAEKVGSWPFLIGQTFILACWMTVNGLVGSPWDPYPFILLNLVLSFQAAYTAPILLMSQNRQNLIDRERAEQDYYINKKAELEIELLHQKVDYLLKLMEEKKIP